MLAVFFSMLITQPPQEDEPLLIEDVDPPKLPSEPEKDATKSRGPMKNTEGCGANAAKVSKCIFFFQVFL